MGQVQVPLVGTFEGEGAADILDEHYAAKPAHRALQAALAGRGRPGTLR